MNQLRRRWVLLSLIYFGILYYLAKFIPDFLPGGWIAVYFILTFLLFLGNLLGMTGLFCHTVLKKETTALRFYSLADAYGVFGSHIPAAYAWLILCSGNPEKAQSIYERALAQNKNPFYTKLLKANIAICKWKSGNPADAYSDYQDLFLLSYSQPLNYSPEEVTKAIEINPGFSPQDFLTLGYFALLNQDLPAAEYFTQVALFQLPDFAGAYDNLGQIALQKGNRTEAEHYFRKALSLDPALSDSLFYLAKLSLQNSNKKEAIAYYQKAIAIPYHYLNSVTPTQYEELSTLLENS